jgi:hypothetical protein
MTSGTAENRTLPITIQTAAMTEEIERRFLADKEGRFSNRPPSKTAVCKPPLLGLLHRARASFAVWTSSPEPPLVMTLRPLASIPAS